MITAFAWIILEFKDRPRGKRGEEVRRLCLKGLHFLIFIQDPYLLIDATAFATRSIPKGSVVAPAPVVQILDRKSLDIIRVKQDPDTGGVDVKEEVKLLLLNYCFGHINSSLLFFPYVSSIMYIFQIGMFHRLLIYFSKIGTIGEFHQS